MMPALLLLLLLLLPGHGCIRPLLLALLLAVWLVPAVRPCWLQPLLLGLLLLLIVTIMVSSSSSRSRRAGLASRCWCAANAARCAPAVQHASSNSSRSSRHHGECWCLVLLLQFGPDLP